MSRISAEKQRQIRERILLLLSRYPNGIKQTEMAQHLGMESRTLNNYLRDLQTEGKLEKDGHLWYRFPEKPVVMRSLNASPEESVILYLASRLFVKQSDTRIELAETVLLKLTDILSEDINLGDEIAQAARELAQRPKDARYEDVFRTIIRAYIYRCRVRIVYQPYRGGAFETVFEPYLLEPSAIGFATYAIGYSSTVDTLRTYKIERIQQAKLLMTDDYTIPPDFPGLDLLRNAWSIYYGEELVEVVLRFHPSVARRVQETNWHPSQQSGPDEDDPSYWCVSFQVADTTDLKPWIRTWGANCEVLETPELRQELMGEARRLAEMYGWYTSRQPFNSDNDPLGLDNTLGDYFS